MIRTLLVATWGVFSTVVCTFLAIGVSFIGSGGDVAHLVARYWARSILLVGRVKVLIRGLEYIDTEAAYVYMANHQSMFDIFALLGFLRVQFRWLAKMELFRVPVFGYSMARVGYISIDRSNRKEAYRSLQGAARRIAQGTSVVIFPEGTRSADGRIMPFKSGGFHLAIASGRPIVPVIIEGTRQIMPKDKFRIKGGRITISVNPPIETSKYNRKTMTDLMEVVRSTMKNDLEGIRIGAAAER